MIEAVRGVVTGIRPRLGARSAGREHLVPASVIVRVGPLSLDLSMSAYDSRAVPRDIEVEILIWMNALLHPAGFLSADGRKIFLLAKTIKGVGVMTALKILGLADVETVRRRLAALDFGWFTSFPIPGVSAARLEGLVAQIGPKVQRAFP